MRVKTEIVLAAALETAEIAPTAAALRGSVPIVRHVGSTRTPLDLRVIPFRYDVRDGIIEAVRPTCHHAAGTAADQPARRRRSIKR